MLERLGCRVDVAGDGAEAVDLCASIPYDVVFMDCHMPKLDGFEATAAIRRAGGPRVPIVAMTANAMAGDREKCLAAGMDDYVSKPIGPDELDRVLEAWAPRNPAATNAAAGVPPRT
jgi:CheY-like chemotaxis protein